MEHWWNDTDRGKLKSLEIYLSQSNYVKNSTSTDQGSNPGFGSERSATKHLSHSSVCLLEYDSVYFDRNIPTFQKYLMPSSSVQFTYPDDGVSMITSNSSKFPPDYTTSHPVRQQIL
jgi:hypothetical protein